MATSKVRRPAATFMEQSLALAWGAWTELGVSGWTSTHTHWAIDVEPLILFTAWLGDEDPRLRDEVTDWCVRNWRFVSKARLKNLLRQQADEVAETFGEFAATIGAHAGISWPGETQPRQFKVTGRSTFPPLRQPSASWLRLRALFGVGARSEILRAFLSEGGLMTVARLSAITGYTKRSVADECDTLERAGTLSLRTRGNRFYFSLSRQQELQAFVGDLPDVRPNWEAIFNVARCLVLLERLAEGVPARTLPVHVQKAFQEIEDDLFDLDVEWSLVNVSAEDLWSEARKFGHSHLGSWSVGRWPSTGSNPEMQLLRPMVR